MSTSSNAAGIYDNGLMNIEYKQREHFGNTKNNDVYFLNDNTVKTTSAYQIELISILKKNTIKHKLQDKSSRKQLDSTASDSIKYNQVSFNGDIDMQVVVKSEMDWTGIKFYLKDAAIFWNEFESRTTDIIDEYIGQNLNTNLVLGSNIKESRMRGDKLNSYEKKISFNSIYQIDTHAKGTDVSYQIPSSFNDDLNGSGWNNEQDSNGDEQKILSVIYLWRMYSDTIIILVSVFVTLWIILKILIKFLKWSDMKKMLRRNGKL